MKPEEEKLRRILANVLSMSGNEINDESSVRTVDSWDSLKHMELIFSFEEEFRIAQLGMDEIAEMTNVAEIKRILRSKGIDL